MERLDLSKPRFTQAEVLSILPQLKPKTLQNWKSRGVLDSENGNPGKGNRHLYTGNGIVMLAFMSRAVEFGIPPTNARNMADRVAVCAQQLWDLRLDEFRPSGMWQFTPPAAPTNEYYRRGFVFQYTDYPDHYRLVVGRKDRLGSIHPRFYSVVAIDLLNINVLNLISRHIAGMPPVEVHIHDTFDDEGDQVEAQHRMILSKIRTLPVDDLEEDNA